MFRSSLHFSGLAGLVGCLALVGAACSARSGSKEFGTGGAPSTGPGGDSTSTGVNLVSSATGMMSTASASNCMNDPNADGDGDGFTGAQGDCNDCDANVNPGAVDTGNDEDCDGVAQAPQACDSGLALADTNAMNGAKALEICQQATGVKWGVLDAKYTHADGSNASADVQVGIMDNFGPNVHPQGGGKMLVLSSGAARLPGQPGACGSESCPHAAGTAPPGFPQDVPNCSGSPDINDDIALELKLRAPTNATGYKFNFKFASFEFPYYVCTEFNDQFIALVNPPPQGSINGNISFDSMKNPVSVNIAFFDVCDPNGKSGFGLGCQEEVMFGISPGPCPGAPGKYCPSGPSQLQGTGFDQWAEDPTYSGATSWLETQAPIKGGDEFTIRYAIWDTGDMNLYSTVIVDNFQWIANGGTVNVGTNPQDNPK